MVLPEGFALPPLPYLGALVFAVGAISVLLYAIRPPVTRWTVVAFAPWMVLGSAFHVLYQLDQFPTLVRPLFGTPSVYLTTFALMGVFWLVFSFIATATGNASQIPRRLGAIGAGLAIVTVGFILLSGLRTGTLTIIWPLVVFVLSVVVTAIAWLALSLTYTSVAANTGIVGALVIFSHVLDGISTAIGYDLLGAGERSPLPREILEFAGTLPTAELIGAGWLFVLVKVALALGVVGLFSSFVREEPTEGYLLLGVIAAVGLGPGVHNVLLFTLGG